MVDKTPKIRFKDYTSSWEQRKFSDLYEKVTEKNDLSFGTDKIISVANMYYKEDTSKSDDDYMKTYNVMRLGDIAFEGNKSKSFAHGRFVENTIGDGIVSHVFDVFRPISEYDLLFWKYLINYEGVMGKIMVRCTKASTMMTNLVANDFLKESIAVPCIEEQRKIGAFLEQLDNLITLHQREYDRVSTLKKAMLKKMFPKNGETKPEIRFSGFTDDWEQRKLNDISDVRDGTHDSPKYQNTGHPFVTSKNVKNGFINYDDIQYISDEDFNEINKRSKVDVNDILMGMIGTIGNMALIRTEPDFAIKNVALIKDTKQINYLYLYHFLHSPFVEKQLSSGMDGGTQKFVSLGNVRNLDIVYPSEAEQIKLGDYFEHLDNLITLHQRKLEKLKCIKKSLLENMFV